MRLVAFRKRLYKFILREEFTKMSEKLNRKALEQGLTEEQAAQSKQQYGTNALAKKETESLWSMFIGAFDDIWIKVLCLALALKVVLAILGVIVPALGGDNDVIEIISIILAIALATGFSTLSEYRNTSRSEALQEEYNKTYAKVFRNGKLVKVLTSDIVKGDTILIQAGDKVDAFRFYPSTACFVQKGPSDTAATQHTNGHQMIYVSLQYHLQVKESIMEGTLFHRS